MTEPEEDKGFVEDNTAAIAGVRRFSHNAMATTFDVFVQHEDEGYAEQAAWATFDEIDRLEADLSRYISNSDVSRINALPVNQRLPVGLATFECLELSVRMSERTFGAFDVTVGRLFDAWLGKGKRLRNPSAQELAEARRRTGSELVELNEDNHTVAVTVEGVGIDLGAVGKGFAADRMGQVLEEWGIERALISAGRSTVLPVGVPRGRNGWPVSLRSPEARRTILADMELSGFAASGSGLEKGAHIIDPRSGEPVRGACAAWATAESAGEADALSTAFMVMLPGEVQRYCKAYPETLAMVITGADDGSGGTGVRRFGEWPEQWLRDG